MWATFQYDYENRLKKITYLTTLGVFTGSTEFVYDPLGRRLKTIEKDASQTIYRERHFVYDGLDMIAEFDTSNAVKTSYTYGSGIDDPVIMRLHSGIGSGNYFYHKNHQGSITEITTATGQIAKMYKYDAYGRKYYETGPSLIDEPAYTARNLHDRSGLYYYRARFYNPQLGRFISQDPIGMLGGTNLYAYVGNNPVNFVDPLGLIQLYLVGTNPEGTGKPDYHTDLARKYAGDSDDAKIIQVRQFSDFQAALTNNTNITKIEYIGEGNDLSGSYIAPFTSLNLEDVKRLNISNLASNAKIYLHGCNTASKDDMGNMSMAEAFRDHFGVETTGWTGVMTHYDWWGPGRHIVNPLSGPKTFPAP